MTSTIRIKRSSVAGKIPNTSNISTGELGLNLADKRLFSSNGSATFELGSNPHSLSVGSGSFTIANGALTFPTADGTSGQVLQTNGSGTLSFADSSGGIALTDLSVSTSAASGNGALSYNNSTGVFTFTPADTDVTQFAPRKLDSISTVNGQATYSMQISASSHSPVDINTLIVSLNGTIQEPGTAFTISGSNITFIPALVTNDVIDFIIDYGRGVTVGSYNDLSNLPNLDQYLQVANANFISSDQLDAYLQVANAATVATSGSYNDLSSLPNLGQYLQVANAATVATSGSYNDLSSLPNLGQYLQVANAATVATSGSYNDLSSLPNLGQYLQVANAATVATSGSYNDLSSLPNLGQYLQVANAATAAITSGTIDGTTIGGSTAAAGTFSSLTSTGGATLSGSSTETIPLEIGTGRSGDGISHIDLVGDTTYSDYGARLIRNGGANADTYLYHHGTGDLGISAIEAGAIALYTTNTERMRINSSGDVGIGDGAITSTLDVHSTTAASEISVEGSGGKWMSLVSGTGTTGPMVVFDNSSTRFRIASGANKQGSGITEIFTVNTGGVTFEKAIEEQQYSLTGTVIDPSNGTIQYKTLSATTTFTESLADGEFVTLMINDGAGYTVNWPTTTWVGGTAPTLETTGYNVIELWQVNGTLYGAFIGAA